MVEISGAINNAACASHTQISLLSQYRGNKDAGTLEDSQIRTKFTQFLYKYSFCRLKEILTIQSHLSGQEESGRLIEVAV